MPTRELCFRRALVVEDSAPIRKTLVRVASAWARDVVPAATVREAVEGLDQAPDLLIADVHLPDGNILDLLKCEAWRSSRAIAVAVTGLASTELGLHLGQLGVDAFLQKPFGPRDFEKVLESLAARSRIDPSEATTPFESRLKAFARMHRLTQPQTAVLRALLSGASRKTLAETLGVSENTCKKTVRRLLARCRARRVADVVSELIAQGAAGRSNQV